MPLLTADRVEAAMRKGGSTRMQDRLPARFKAGDHVIARNIHPAGHTRIPRYVRGRRGVIDRDHGVFIFPDAHAKDGGKVPQRLYSVRFAAEELWGHEATGNAIYADLFDSYLEPAA
ncbi:MAG: SH3-like domain-containing protein [Gammaproteobacteria bacterium]